MCRYLVRRRTKVVHGSSQGGPNGPLWALCKKLTVHLLFENAWSDFNQTWQESSLGAGDSKLFIWYMQRCQPLPISSGGSRKFTPTPALTITLLILPKLRFFFFFFFFFFLLCKYRAPIFLSKKCPFKVKHAPFSSIFKSLKCKILPLTGQKL